MSSIYFFIHYTRTKREEENDVNFVKPKDVSKQPKCIYCDDNYDVENNIYNYNKIFEANKTNAKGKKNTYEFHFELNDDIYIIKFDADTYTYIYEINLIYGRKILDIRRKIVQNKIEYKDKIEYFIESLKNDNQKIEALYNDTLELFIKKKGFALLIPLFLKVYENKELCNKLSTQFKGMNEKPQDNAKNMDRNRFLEDYKTEIVNIAKTFINKDDYNITYFYGIILCYLNYYDYDNFSSIFGDLFKKRKENLYEILLIYHTHFKNPINQDLNFFSDFIYYILNKKDFNYIQIGLNYIKDIEIFIFVIESNKEEILKKYQQLNKQDNFIFKVNDNLEFKVDDKKNSAAPINNENEICEITPETDSKINIKNKESNKQEIIKNLKKIIKFNGNQKIIIIYFTNDFWKYLLNYYKAPTQDNILICFKLRKIFLSYFNLVNEKIKENIPIKKDATFYYDTDEFAFLLNKNINIYFENNNELKNIEKLNYIKLYNPFYQEPKYLSRVNANIFNSFNLTEIDNEFIIDFRRMKFEDIFKEKLDEFILKITSKVNNIFSLYNIVKLINIKRIKNKNKVLEPLNKKYDSIKKEIEELKDNDLTKSIEVLAYFFIFNYINISEQKKKDEYIKRKISELSNNIIPKIYLEIVKIYFDKKSEKNKDFEEEKNIQDLNEEDQKEESISENINIDKDQTIKEKDNEDSNSSFEEGKKDIKECYSEDDENNFDCKDFKALIDYIFDRYIEKLEDENDINNIIKLIECLKGKFQSKEKKDDKNNNLDKEQNINNERMDVVDNFLDKLLTKYKFDKEEFFSGKKNYKILLLCELYDNGLLALASKDKEYYDNITKTLMDIKKDIDGELTKKNLDEFLKNEESFIIKRLHLISLLTVHFDNKQIIEIYNNLNSKNKKINESLVELKGILDNINIYFSETKKALITKIRNTIRDIQTIKIKEFEGGNIKNVIQETEDPKLKELKEQIEGVKYFLLFNVIYENTPSNNEQLHFENSLTKLQELNKFLNQETLNDIYEPENKSYQVIIEKTNKILSTKKEEESKFFFDNFIKYYNITDKNLIKDLTILFKSKKFELDINGIIFFFRNFGDDNDDLNKNLKKYENLSTKNFNEIKEILNELEQKKIYTYSNVENYNKLFTYLYEKKEAIEFLFSKKGSDIYYLEERIQPTTTTLKIEDIESTQKCIEFMDELIQKKNNNERFKKIKSLNDSKIISHFEIYSKVFTSVIELDRYYDSSENIYEQVKKIIEKNLSINILQYTENFSYESSDGIKEISMEELIHLKNKITIKDNNKNKKKKEIEITDNKNDNSISKTPTETTNENKKDIIKEKLDTLILFKNLIINLEIINEYMKDLRIKGSSLPIQLKINMKNMKEISYNLGKLKDLADIKTFLSKAKNKYTSQLDSMYKDKPNLRFLYGKHFKSILKHLEVGRAFNIDSFLRYILNITDIYNNNKKIKEGFIALKRNVRDYITYYEKYNEDSLEAISEYITTLFVNNNIEIQDHYDKMKIYRDIENPSKNKGIFLYKTNNNSMEKVIIDLFWDKMNKFPIAQNVLITSKETSYEEIQAFFHRAILCNYYTLFVVEITDSISEYQQTIINTFLDQLLNYKKETKEISRVFDKKNTDEYLDSCIVFIYDEDNKNITSFLKEIKKLKTLKMEIPENIGEIDIKMLGDIKIITSDFCGAGKSGKIKKVINEGIKEEKNGKEIIIKQKKHYFHFPLGGILSKDIIFNKLKNLLEKIKENNYEYKNVAIHLDLTESEEKSILNEFFFSFLITKFYMNDEYILYIPKDIDIYIEIPNCFNDYLKKFSILNIFEKDNITFEKMEEFNYSQDILDIFNKMLEIKTNKGIREFVKKNIGISKYSYHQINIFIKLFISQYNQFNKKLKFKDNGVDVTEKCIRDFARCTRYFTFGGFAKLLTNQYKTDNNNYIDILTEIYTNDLQNMKFPDPLIFIIKEKMVYENLFIPAKNSDIYKNTEDYLVSFKKILNLPNPVKSVKGQKDCKYKSLMSIIEEENNNYVITNDNFKKMVLLVYRIKANVPVIIMGDTGCGKTALITKLNQILNNGETTLEIINIHPGINDEKLTKIMDSMNTKTKDKNGDFWLFFDEINTCLSLSLITEIFINRTYNGIPLSDNIRLIGACNPYRKRKNKKEKCGLSLSDDNENELVYLVQPLPQSLLYYVFSFGSIDDEDERKYIHSIIEKSFLEEKEELMKKPEYCEKLKEYENKQKELNQLYDSKNANIKEEEIRKLVKEIESKLKSLKDELIKLSTPKIHEITTEAISKCHIYLRKTFDPSVVSLREIARFNSFIKFFKEYFKIKNQFEHKFNNEKNNKIRSIICTIYLCYYIRLTDEDMRHNFEVELRETFLRLVNNGNMSKKKGKDESISEQMLNEELKKELNNRQEIIDQNFSDFIQIEQDYIINQIKDLDKGIGKNSLLKENIFLLFISVITNIPLIIIGKPGSGKSLSAQIIKNSMKGKYSSNKYFNNYKRIIQTYFQGSESTIPVDVENLFEKAGKKLNYYKDNCKDLLDLPISMALFDELGLAEKSKTNPLKVLHSKLEYGGKEEGVSFVGISNYVLDAAKINRAVVLSVPDLDQKLDQLIETSTNIVENISSKIKNDKIFKLISHTYFEYKRYLNIIKELVVCKTYCQTHGDVKTNEEKLKDESNEKKEEIDGHIIEQSNIEISQLRNDLINNYNENLSEKTNSIKQENIINDSSNEIKVLNTGHFDFIKKKKDFQDLMKKEKNIRTDFHGNRDFYYLIKGIAYDLGKLGDYNDDEKIKIIIKHIERNFGGIEYNIDIDFDSKLNGIEKNIKLIQTLLEDREVGDEKEKTIKVNSVYLFKKLFNLQCDELESSNLKIPTQKINDYNLNQCINDNIRDINSRFALLEIDQSLTSLICQNIISQNDFKTIKLYDGSPLAEDDNKEYRFIKINEIMNDAKEDQLIIIENLNQIHAFLYDLYNMNYEIIDGKKYARICLDNNTEQKALVHNNFRIIILVDRNFVDSCNLAFLNRLEKMNLSFGKLLNKKLKDISNDIIDNFNLKISINSYKKINYSLRDLLINCKLDEIQGMIYYYNKKNKKNVNELDNEAEKEEKIDVNELQEIVTNKIYKILPQDIIAILPDENILKKKYLENKEVYNYKDLIEFLNNEKNKSYQLSIVYTFTSSAEVFDGLNNDMSLMISRIKSENSLKYNINEIKRRNEKEKNIICIHFEQTNLPKIKFICNFILNNFKDDGYKYMMLVHINRNFNKRKKEKIFSLPDINPNIYQIFIDNLNGDKNIKINALINNDIQNILRYNKDELKLDEEFETTKTNFIKKEFKESEKLMNDYIKDFQDYISDDFTLKNKILEKTYDFIEANKEKDENCKDIFEQIFNKGYVNKFTLDIASCSIQFIKEEIFNKYLIFVLQTLEDNNILTTFIEYKKNQLLDENIFNIITTKYFDNLKLDLNQKKCKFLFNYNVPCFYNFFVNISDYVKKNISSNYLYEEKIIRELKKDNDEMIEKFHKKEEDLLDIISKEFTDNYKFIIEVINECSSSNDKKSNIIFFDLIFKDYITYYLQKYYNEEGIYKKNDIYHNIIELLLNLRFSEERKIIQDQSNNNTNILLLKIIWMESNVNYILNIIKIIEKAKEIYNEDENKLYKAIKEKQQIIRYIYNENINSKDSKEVNECYYKILASICYSITSDDAKQEINKYCRRLKEINDLLQNLNEDLNLFLNEMYIIDELIEVIEIFKYQNNERIIQVKNYIIKNAEDIQKYANKNQDTLYDKISKNFDELYLLINNENDDEKIVKKDDSYYDRLRYIFFKEIKKISEPSYQYHVLKKLIKEKEIVKKSIDIFEILLQNYLNKEDFKNNMDNNFKNSNFNKIIFGKDPIVTFLNDKLYDVNFTLEETLLYLFEKNSLINLSNFLKNNTDLSLSDQPLGMLKKCIDFLDDYENNPTKVEKFLKDLGKLYSIAYIKTYCNEFIKIINNTNKCFNFDIIIDIINQDKSICKMIRLYIYKILYNKYTLSFISDNNIIEKNKLDKYSDFVEIQKFKETDNKIEQKNVKTLIQRHFKITFDKIEKLRTNKYNQKLNKEDFNIKDFGFDNFFIASFNSTLSNLYNLGNKDLSDNNQKFYNNICASLFNGDIILKGIELLYNPQKFKEIQRLYRNISNCITPLLFGYRYCLNILASKTTNGIYYLMYTNKNLRNYLDENYFPGNDTKFNLVYSNIENHFKNKPDEGCYVCLCRDWYYNSVSSGFPDMKELNKRCPKCKENIGLCKRENYYRIFKDETEIKNLRNRNRDTREKMDKINCITLEEFKKKYIVEKFKNEIGVYKTDINNFKNNNKIIRNLSQVSYRLLNYILYINLFYARMILRSSDLDKYLPKNQHEELTWPETILECWNLLKSQLLELNIYSIEEFMHYIFVDLFNLLNKITTINNYDSLIENENNLENKIKELIDKFKESNKPIVPNNDDKLSIINLIKEQYNLANYESKEYPFCKYLNYTDYLDEKYIKDKLINMSEEQYPILNIFLQSKTDNKNSSNYSLDNLNIFNKPLNLLNQKYLNNISTNTAETTKLKDVEIYTKNKELFDNFIEFYNKLGIEGDLSKLSNENTLNNFFINENNKYGIEFKNIYKQFIKQQSNEKIRDILDMKNLNLQKANIQQIEEKELLTLKLPENVLFIDLLFSSSYRKILDNNSMKYKEYNINFDFIEERLFELLLKNKKLLNEDITEFIYNNELFSFQLNDFFTSIRKKYTAKLLKLDGETIYKFCKENQNIQLHKKILNSFIELMRYLLKEDNIVFEEKITINEVIDKLKEKLSNQEVKKLFETDNDEANKSLTLDKIVEIFDFYLKCIFDIVKVEIKKYQSELNNKDKENIDKYFEDKNPITKKDLANAIRLFTTLVLLQEEDKENKIKNNSYNIANYLKPEDLWSKDTYKHKDFKIYLNKLNLMNIKINQIILLYEYLDKGNNIEDNFFSIIKKSDQEKEKDKIKNESTNKTNEGEKIDENIQKEEEEYEAPDEDDD